MVPKINVIKAKQLTELWHIDIVTEFASSVARWEVLTDHINLIVGRFFHTATEQFCRLPYNLSKMSGVVVSCIFALAVFVVTNLRIPKSKKGYNLYYTILFMSVNSSMFGCKILGHKASDMSRSFRLRCVNSSWWISPPLSIYVLSGP